MKKKTFAGQAVFVFTMITLCFCSAAALAAERMQPQPPPRERVERQPASRSLQRAQHGLQRLHRAAPVILRGDLSIRKLTCSPASPQAGNTVTLKATIKNSGPLAFKGAVVRFYLGRRRVSRDRQSTIDLAAGKTTEVKFSFVAKKQGRLHVRALVVAARGQEDHNPSNNSASLRLTIAAAVKTLRPTGPAAAAPLQRVQPARKAGISKTVSGKIYNVKAKIQTLAMKAPGHPKIKGWQGRFLDIRWSKKGKLDTRVRILLYPAGQTRLAAAGQGIWLTKSAANSGHFRSPLSRIKRTGRYVIRVQTLKGLAYGDSKAIILSGSSPKTHRAPAATGSVAIKGGPKIPAAAGMRRKKTISATISPQKRLQPMHRANLSKAGKEQQMMLYSGNSGAGKPDLVLSVQATNTVYLGDGHSLTVEVWNKGDAPARTFSIGFCLAGEKNSKKASKWLGTRKIQFLGPSNVMRVTIPWQVQVLANSKNKFVAEADCYQTVDEGKTGEQNNQTQAFAYQVGPSILLPAPLGKPVPGFKILFPCSGCRQDFKNEEDTSVIFGVNEKISNDPLALSLMSSYVDIFLLRENGGQVFTIAENAYFIKTYATNFWHWMVPATLPKGKYRIYIRSTDGRYDGKSVAISIWSPKIAQLAAPSNTARPWIATPSAQNITRVGQPPPGEVPLKISGMQIKSLVPKTAVLSGGSYGAFARLSSIDIVLEFECNKDFKFANSLNPANLKAAAAWFLAVPEIKVVGFVFPMQDLSQLYPFTAFRTDIRSNMYYNCYDPSGAYPWSETYHLGPRLQYPQGTITKGKHTITLKVDDPGVIHGLKVAGRFKTLKTYHQGIIEKHKWGWSKCIKHYYPAFGVNVDLRYKGTPHNSVETTATAWARKSYRFKAPPVWQYLDTTLTSYQLGFVPSWSFAVEFPSYNYCDESYEKTLIGGP